MSHKIGISTALRSSTTLKRQIHLSTRTILAETSHLHRKQHWRISLLKAECGSSALGRRMSLAYNDLHPLVACSVNTSYFSSVRTLTHPEFFKVTQHFVHCLCIQIATSLQIKSPISPCQETCILVPH